jgi:hypothetical protein
LNLGRYDIEDGSQAMPRFTYDLERYWMGYHRLKAALELISDMEGEEGRLAQAAAVRVLRGEAPPTGLACDVTDLLREVFAGLEGAERALLGHGSQGANVGLASDAETDREGLRNLVGSFLSRHG